MTSARNSVASQQRGASRASVGSYGGRRLAARCANNASAAWRAHGVAHRRGSAHMRRARAGARWLPGPHCKIITRMSYSYRARVTAALMRQATSRLIIITPYGAHGGNGARARAIAASSPAALAFLFAPARSSRKQHQAHLCARHGWRARAHQARAHMAYIFCGALARASAK